MPYEETYAELPPRLRAALDRQPNPKGVWRAFANQQTIAEMQQLALSRRPPVIAVGDKLLELGEWVRADDAKRVFGRLAAYIAIEKLGLVQGKSGIRTPESRLFTKGTRFHPPAAQSINAENQKSSVGASQDSAISLTTDLLHLAAVKYSHAQLSRLSPSECAVVQRAIEILK